MTQNNKTKINCLVDHKGGECTCDLSYIEQDKEQCKCPCHKAKELILCHPDKCSICRKPKKEQCSCRTIPFEHSGGFCHKCKRNIPANKPKTEEKDWSKEWEKFELAHTELMDRLARVTKTEPLKEPSNTSWERELNLCPDEYCQPACHERERERIRENFVRFAIEGKDVQGEMKGLTLYTKMLKFLDELDSTK